MFLQCVICLSAKASMQTQPCGHRVVCRLCFVKTIQATVAQRTLPLRCVVCRTKILKLKQAPPPSQSSAHSGQFRSTFGSAVAASSVAVFRSRSSVRSSAATVAAAPSSTVPAAASGVQTARAQVASAAASSSPRHAPTPTKLIQPLLIYPASSSAPHASATAHHCGHHRQLSHHHNHHHYQLQQNQLHHQQQQQPRRVMAAWSSDEPSSIEAPLDVVAAAATTTGSFGRGGLSMPASGIAASNDLYHQVDATERSVDCRPSRLAQRGLRTTSECSPLRHLTSVAGFKTKSSSLPHQSQRHA